jgi:hypothetical protein
MSFEVTSQQAALFNKSWQTRDTPVLPAVTTPPPRVTPESVKTADEVTSAKADATLSKWSAKVGFDDAQSSSHSERVSLAAAIYSKLSAADKQQFANEMLGTSGAALNFGLPGVMAAPQTTRAGPVAAPQAPAPTAPTAPTAPASTGATAQLTSSDPQQAAQLADITDFLNRIKALLEGRGDFIAAQVDKVASTIKVPEGGKITDADLKNLATAVQGARQQTFEAVREGAGKMVAMLSQVNTALNGVPNAGELKAAIGQALTGWQNLVSNIANGFSLPQVEALNAASGKAVEEANKFMDALKTSIQPVVPKYAVGTTPIATASADVSKTDQTDGPTKSKAGAELDESAKVGEYGFGSTSIQPFSTAGGGKPKNSVDGLTQSKGFAEADKLAAEEKKNTEQAEEIAGTDR